MTDSGQSQTICRSVFKNGENAALKSQLTKIWIELINMIEKNKSITVIGK